MVISVQPRLRRGVVVGVIGVIAALVIMFWSHVSRAEAWSWTAAPATVFSSNPIADMGGVATCPTAYQTRNIAGEIGEKKVCVTAGKSIRYGTYYSGYVYTPVISFGYDSLMYKLKGTVCGRFDDCAYLPQSDVLVTRQQLGRYPVYSLVIYKNFTERLTKTLNELTPTTEYRFDDSEPDYVFESAGSYDWPVGGFSASKNGKWVAVEFRQRGIGLLNTETLSMKRISTLAYSYGTGRDPQTQLAVSNNGDYVAVGGINAGLTMLEVTAACGDEATDFKMQNVFPIAERCKGVEIDKTTFIDRFKDSLHPRFSDDGAELSFYATSYNGEQREVVLQAAGYTAPRLDYLALGDSFSSGEGETDDSFYLEGTNDEFEKCHVSTRSYPYLIAASLGIAADKMKSVACSGAVTEDVVGSDEQYLGQSARLGKDGLGLNAITLTISKSSAKESFIPGRVHQIRFVERYRPKVITIGIGGNDAGFMDKLRACMGTDTCDWANTSEGKEKTALELQSLFTTLYDTYTEIYAASPQSKIYVVGYPKIIDSTGQCDPLHGLLLNTTERTFMNEGIEYINQIVAAAAAKAGVKYIDIQDSFGDQVLCGQSSPSVMNGIRTGNDSELSEKAPWLKLIGNEGFHPRPAGHALAADSILQAVPNLLTYSYCPEGKAICPSNTTAPQPSDYWLQDGQTHGYPSQKIGNFVRDQVDATSPRQKTISLASRSLMPGSTIQAEVHSQPTSLGLFSVDANGAATFNIELPADLPEGFHTVHLYGTSYSGEQLDLYQVIKYQLPTVEPSPQEPSNSEPTPDDPIEEDVPNEQQVPANPPVAAEETTQGGEDEIVKAVKEPSSTETTPQSSPMRDGVLAITTPSDTQSSPNIVSEGSSPVATIATTRQQAGTSTTDDSNIPATSFLFAGLVNNLQQNSSDFIIPGVAWLFIGTSFAIYARLRRGR